MSTTELKRTAFDAVQREAGAAWTDWEGWAWAADFGDAVAEHQATRTACNMWDESPLRKWILRGPDAISLADALFTNDMAALEVGQVRYGAICDEQGKMIMDGTVFKLADDHCLSITSYDSDLDWFRQVATDRGFDVQVEDRTAQMPHLQVQGPKAREVLGPITEGADVTTLRYFRFVPEGVTVGGVPCWLSRTGYSGELGFEVYCAVDDAPKLWHAVVRAGEPHGLRPIGLSAIETLRIESGLLFPDIDYFPHQTDPFEVRLDKVVKLDKPGDFVGREALSSDCGSRYAAAADDAADRRRRGPRVRSGGDAGWSRSRDRPQPLPESDVRHAGDRHGGDRPRSGAGRPAGRGDAGRRHDWRHGGAVPPLRHGKAPAAQLNSRPLTGRAR